MFVKKNHSMGSVKIETMLDLIMNDAPYIILCKSHLDAAATTTLCKYTIIV